MSKADKAIAIAISSVQSYHWPGRLDILGAPICRKRLLLIARRLRQTVNLLSDSLIAILALRGSHKRERLEKSGREVGSISYSRPPIADYMLLTAFT